MTPQEIQEALRRSRRRWALLVLGIGALAFGFAVLLGYCVVKIVGF